MHEGFPTLLGAGLILLSLFLFGFIGTKVRLPGVILYILLGIGLGQFMTDNELIHIGSEMGIVLLFFLLGMEFPVDKLGGIAKRIWPAGLLDVFLNLGVSMGICYLFGVDLLTSFLIGGVVYATSSSITAKLLESSKRMANIESEFILALLIFEDLIAPIFVAVLMGMNKGDELEVIQLVLLIGKIVLLSLGAILLGKLLFKRLSSFFDRIFSEDVFILLMVGIALSYGGLALFLGLSEVLGAFLAGMMLAEVRRTEEIEHKMLPLRDLLLPLFFLYFGTTIKFEGEIPLVGLLISLLVWSIAAKILVGILGGMWYGLSKRVSLRAGLSLTSRGEFSVVIASIAVGSIKIFSGLFILLSALLGIFLFQFAPRITNLIYGDPKKGKQKIKVPG
ncbi:cation:proton antiporter [Ammoniphilus sp. CFH 90114]|uniref:cation:proton antiporter n=1 Tax=Ammoniphilus sp. CFH 90114 TaxID=2493665 RepID=UPI00100F4EBF|nr:cation:proton antiporter [Ammoniphilus sp. CFH 90114]RXT04900.1 cation:proton antiporter [Ammoniphilus sp. CFH 90114]